MCSSGRLCAVDLDGGRLAETDAWTFMSARFMPAADPRTGTPMEAALLLTNDTQNHRLLRSYYSRELIYDLLVVTDQDSYRFDEMKSTIDDGRRHGSSGVAAERMSNGRGGFHRGNPRHTRTGRFGLVVLPAMRVSRSGPQAIWTCDMGGKLCRGDRCRLSPECSVQPNNSARAQPVAQPATSANTSK